MVAVLVWAVAAHSSRGAGHPQRYVVRQHDTLWSIAVSHYGGDTRDAIWKLRQRNGLTEVAIQPGQTLVLP